MAAEIGFWGGITFLQVWAVVGPLLGAGISARWNRKNAIEDREYQKKIDTDKRQEKKVYDTQQTAIKAKEEYYKKTLSSFQEFVVYSRQYLEINKNLLSVYLSSGTFNTDDDKEMMLRNKIDQCNLDIEIYVNDAELILGARDLQIAMYQTPETTTLSEEILAQYGLNYTEKETEFINLIKKYIENNKTDIQT